MGVKLINVIIAEDYQEGNVTGVKYLLAETNPFDRNSVQCLSLNLVAGNKLLSKTLYSFVNKENEIVSYYRMGDECF